MKGGIDFSHPNYLENKIDDIYSLADDTRESIMIVLRTGHKVSGTVTDVLEKPVPNVMIKAVRADGAHRKATMTDANGKFLLQGLSEGASILSVLSFDIQQKIQLPISIDGDKSDLPIRLQAIVLPKSLKTYSVLGMQLTDFTPELKVAYDFQGAVSGALILNPGTDSDRLKIGTLAKGYNFWMVGNTKIGSVHEFVKQILAEAALQKPGEYSIRVVYSLSTLDFDGTNTQYLELTNDDVERLKTLLDQIRSE